MQVIVFKQVRQKQLVPFGILLVPRRYPVGIPGVPGWYPVGSFWYPSAHPFPTFGLLSVFRQIGCNFAHSFKKVVKPKAHEFI